MHLHKIHLTGLSLLFVFVAASMFVSCSSDDDNPQPSDSKSLTLYVGVYGWSKNMDTRATYSNMQELNGYKRLPLSFGNGDAIGVFIVDKSGNVVVANRKYTFNGTSWSSGSAIEYTIGMGSYTYYAYYPYQESLTGAHAVGDNTGNISDIEFFSSTITNWQPAADQSTLASFTGSDLMTAQGTVTMPLFHEVHVEFILRHRMGLLVTKPVLTYYSQFDSSDTWEVTQTFTGNIPYAIGEERYFIAKPDEETQLGTKVATVGSGEVEQLYYTNGEPSSR